MTTLRFVLPFVFCLTACESTTGPTSFQPLITPEDIDDDAALLALREMAKQDSLANLPVYIDAALAREFEDVLEAVRDAPLAAAESATALYPIRARGEAWQIVVEVPANTPEVDPWRHGEMETGIAGLDSLVLRYDLALVSVHDWDILGTDGFLFQTEIPLNLEGLRARFEREPLVEDAWANGSNGPFSDIRAEARAEGGWTMTYWILWGDCIAGCYAGHYWRFNVDADGSVTFVESGGDPVPPPEDYHPSI